MTSLKYIAVIVILGVLIVGISCDNDSEETTQQLRVGEVRMGSYGYKCVSECKKRGYDYYWCKGEHPTKHFKGDEYWDYCSKEDGLDYKGKTCYIHGHACGNHGYKYKWCYTNEAKTEWGYCGYTTQNNRT